MSLTSDELNYLIWRYLQETGLPVAALALQDETAVTEFDEHFKAHVPIGSLVNLVQKGILYSDVNQMLSSKGEVPDTAEYQDNFSLFHALGTDKATNGAITPNKGRFEENHWTDNSSELSSLPTTKNTDKDVSMDDAEKKEAAAEPEVKREASPEFIKVLETVTKFGPSTTSQWSPCSPTSFAFGLTGSRAKISVLAEGSTEPQQLSLSHPQVFGSDGKEPDVTALAWAPKGQFLVTGVESGEMRLWTSEGRLRNVMFLHHAPIIMIRWSESGDHILSTDSENVTILWDASSGHVLQHYDTLKHADSAPPSAVSLTSSTTTTPSMSEARVLGTDSAWIDETKFIVPGLNGSVLICSARDRHPVGTLFGHTKPLSVIDFNSEYSMLLTASDDRTLRVWNGASFNNSQILMGHSQPITYGGWISRDFVISCALDSSIRLWSVSTARQVDIAVTDGIPIMCGAVSVDKKKIAVGTQEGLVMIYEVDLHSDKPLKKIGEYQPLLSVEQDPSNVITSLTWSSDSSKIIVGYSHTESVVLKSF